MAYNRVNINRWCSQVKMWPAEGGAAPFQKASVRMHITADINADQKLYLKNEYQPNHLIYHQYNHLPNVLTIFISAYLLTHQSSS